MKRFDQINMVPFIDVVLVLLAIVMTTASFIAKGIIEVDLPQADSAETQESSVDYKEIAIDKSSVIFFQGEQVSQEQLDHSLALLPKSTDINLRVDKEAKFDAFMQVVDALKKLDLKKVAIETDQNQ